jgi:hypothetical protein
MTTHWQTWEGTVLDFDRLTWQHLSNIHYYMNLVLPEFYPRFLKDRVRRILFQKHGGILPYHPDRNYAYEKIQLVRLGYLKNNGDIVVHNHKIGWYEEPLVKQKT